MVTEIASPTMTGKIDDQYDCLVIGGGPAGGTTASFLAKMGHKTLLAERQPVPRFSVGESLMPETYWIFEKLGVLDAFKEIAFTKKYGVQFVTAKGKESKPFDFSMRDPSPASQTWHVERRDLDTLLLQTAQKNGAHCRDATRVLNVQLAAEPKENHSVMLRLPCGAEQTVSCKVIVDASGQQSVIANRLGLKKVDPELKKAAIWGYFENAVRAPEGEPEVTVILHTSDRKAWFWYIPLRNGLVSIGAVGDNGFMLKSGRKPEEQFEFLKQQCPGIMRRAKDAKMIEPLRVAKEFSYTTTQRVGQGWVLVGDAYGFIDPVYSSGVMLALKSGDLAATAIDKGLKTGDLSADVLGSWTKEFDSGVYWIRKLVQAFYTDHFSFGAFMKAHPEHQNNLTDLLVGKVFDDEAGKIFEDMTPWIEKMASMPS